MTDQQRYNKYSVDGVLITAKKLVEDYTDTIGRGRGNTQNEKNCEYNQITTRDYSIKLLSLGDSK